MDDIRPVNADKRPKRRHDKDNPYWIYSIGLDSDEPHYFVTFMDNQKVKHCMEIDKKLFDEFNKFELEDLSFLNVVDNHYERSELTETSLNRRAFKPREAMDDTVLRKIEYEDLHKAVGRLPEVQRRRLILYYFEGLTYQQIAELESCKRQAVCESVAAALKKLKNFLI